MALEQSLSSTPGRVRRARLNPGGTRLAQRPRAKLSQSVAWAPGWRGAGERQEFTRDLSSRPEATADLLCGLG